MKIQTLNLTNYRNHLSLKIKFDSELITIIGPNGAGKTNILESIHLLSTGKSPRTKYDVDLINYEKSFCTINSKVHANENDFELEMQIIREEETEHSSIKKVKVNKVSKTMHYFCGLFTSVLFMPEDIQLITGSPSERRRYIDAVLIQIDTNYKRTLNSYTKAIKQRNKVLEKINREGRGWDEIDYWTDQTLRSGKILQEKRYEMFENMQIFLEKNSKLLNGATEVLIRYKRNELNRERLEKYRDREIAAKATLIGPHRDDFEIYLDEHNVAEFGSRGQQRSVILALKLSEIELIEKEKGERPVLLLDDIFSELDEKHQKAVLSVIGNQQTIVTSTENLDFLPEKNLQKISVGP